MDLKNAAAVCLISLFSATLVVLIARALDLQAAAKLEPQLARVAEELEALRQQGGLAAAPAAGTDDAPMEDALVVYYFHGNTRCPTCRAIESQSHETVRTDFAAELDRQEVVWKTLNYEEPSGEQLAKQFEIQMPVIVLARMAEGQIDEWQRLDKVWALVGDKPAFAEYVRDAIAGMLDPAAGSATHQAASEHEAAEIPLPDDDLSDIPVPAAPAYIPVPE